MGRKFKKPKIKPKTIRRLAGNAIAVGATGLGAYLGGGTGAKLGATLGGKLGARVGVKGKDKRAAFRARYDTLGNIAGIGTAGASGLGLLGKERALPDSALFGKIGTLFTGRTGEPGMETEGEEPVVKVSDGGPVSPTYTDGSGDTGQEDMTEEEKAAKAKRTKTFLLIGGVLVAVSGAAYFMLRKSA